MRLISKSFLPSPRVFCTNGRRAGDEGLEAALTRRIENMRRPLPQVGEVKVFLKNLKAEYCHQNYL